MLPIFLLFTAAFALIAWRDLHVGLLLLIALLPSYLLRTEIFGIPTTLLEMMIIVFVIVWLITRRPRLSHFFSLPSSISLPIFLFLLASLISLFIAPDFTTALGVWKAYFLEPIILFLIIRHENLDPSKIFKVLGITAFILSVVAIAQWLTDSGIPIPWDIERRVTSVFDYPNALGLFLGPIVIIGVLSWRTTNKWFWLSMTILSSIAIILAQSEAAIVAILATLIIAGLLNAQTRMRTILAVLVMLIAISISPWRGFVIEKLTLQDYSGQVRLTQWNETNEMLRDHWLLGAGLSGYPTIFELYHEATHIEIFQYPHNIILNVWVELGLLGVIAFALLAYQVLRRLPTTLSTSSTFSTPPPLLAFFALLTITIHGLVDVPYFKNDLTILTWILLAIIFTYAPHQTPAQKKS